MDLRLFTISDAPTIFSWIKDKTAFRKWSADRYPVFPPEPEDMAAQYAADNIFPFTAVDSEGNIVGHIMLRYPEPSKAVIRFGFVILDDRLRGKGYGKQMLQLAILKAKQDFGAQKITLGVFDNNPSALHCYESVGFVVTGTDTYVIDGEEWSGKEMELVLNMNKEQRFCQSCGMPLTEDVLGTNADGSKNEDYCMYCYKDGKFLQDCTMEEMIEHCAQFVGAVNEGLEKPITKEEYIGMMKTYFPQLKRWRKTLDVSSDEVMTVNPALAGVKELIAQMADKQPIAYISSVDQDGFPWTKAMLKPRKREGIKTFYFTTNTFSIRVAQYKANPKASIYFCDAKGFKGMMLRGTMEVLTDAASKEMIWRDGDTEYYPGGVTDPNYCVLKFTATDGRFYSDFYPRSFVIE